jgi:threonine dehydratase
VLNPLDGDHLSVPQPRAPVTIRDVELAAARLAPYVRRTPILRIEIDGRAVTLKLEHTQRSGSFKVRGALNALISGPSGGTVVAASGGNHGLGVATAAAIVGRRARIFVPVDVPAAKAQRIEAAGAELVRHGHNFAVAAERALDEASRDRHQFVHPYDDAAVIAGQGTAALEILEDAPEIDGIVVAGGGGGLAAGVAVAAADREIEVVEPERCNAVEAGLAAGRPVDAPVTSIAASALGASRAGILPLQLLMPRRPRAILVSDDEIRVAQLRLWDECRLAVEPAGAVAFAAWLAGRISSRNPCLVLCGGNSDWRPA